MQIHDQTQPSKIFLVYLANALVKRKGRYGSVRSMRSIELAAVALILHVGQNKDCSESTDQNQYNNQQINKAKSKSLKVSNVV